jgi:two-component system response regulator HydG
MEKILIVDDNEYLRFTLSELLEGAGFAVSAVEDGGDAIRRVKEEPYSLVILDMKLKEMDGSEVLRRIKSIKESLPVIILTAFGDIKSAVETIKMGANDYVTKPFDNDDMLKIIRKTLDMSYLNQEVNILRKKMDESYKSGDVVGKSEVMLEVFEQVKIVAPTNLTVMIEGESGTGKEIIANMIHRLSDRNKNALISVDCGAIPDTLIESELFGHEKGAYTDAKNMKEGKFELANNGTIFLDEITNLSDSNQIKLLRIIQERKVTRLGSKKPIDLNVRIIVASNIRLSDAVNNKTFRHDLYYRLNEFHIDLPPLRERKEDIPLFVEYFMKDANRELNKSVTEVSPVIMEKLVNHSWPGNVRELRNVIRRSVLLSLTSVINTIQIPDEIFRTPQAETVSAENDKFSIKHSTKAVEKELIIKALNESGGNKSKAAKILNMNERTFYRRLKSLGIE